MKITDIGIFKALNSRNVQNSELERYIDEFVGSVFSKILKDLDKTIPKNDLIKESNGERWFKEMLYDEYSIIIARENFGDIRQKILSQLSLKSYNINVDK
ncbi:MAG: rRNA (adenine-N6)-dimethyltransferase [Thermotogaceae bacterium]|nr:rRNA (adenine-N6)-dimethyltransferase [Thermotogaceae bacterium]MDN5337783.1 rRNA (adenine-N6)-dimethyltransferase [Thermotogaceae bacterium]